MGIRETGGPAFPVKASADGVGQYDRDGVTVQHTGLTVRDQFAMAALNSPQLVREGLMLDYDAAARAAYRLADAMLEARNANR